MNKGKCCIFGGDSLYRLPIYNLLADRINCDYYIGYRKNNHGIAAYHNSALKNYIGSGEIKSVLYNFFVLKGALRLLFADYEYYIVGGPFCLTAWIMIFLSSFTEKKIVSWSHGMYGKEKGLRKWIKVFFYKSCHKNLVYNNYAVELMGRMNIVNTYCVYNSIDTEKDLIIRKGLHKIEFYSEIFQNKYPNLIFVGRITKVKKLEMVIDAIKILHDKGFPLNFLVVGKDVEGVDLHSFVSKAGLSRYVHFYGPCYDDTILGNMFYNADVCVSPGNVGLTAMSSLTFGCPVITHNDFSNQMPEFEAIIPGKTGDFFKKNDINDLAAKIYEWTYNRKSSREQIVAECYKEIDAKWNIFTEAAVFEKLFCDEV